MVESPALSHDKVEINNVCHQDRHSEANDELRYLDGNPKLNSPTTIS